MFKTFEYYTVQNTGQSGAVAWFSDSIRYSTLDRALNEALHDKKYTYTDNVDMLWRVVHTQVIKTANQTITIETYTEVK